MRALATLRGSGGLVLAAALALNGLLLYNAVAHNAYVGYDAPDHLRYVLVLANTGRLPDRMQSREFFCPPGPYVVPALLRAAGMNFEVALKLGQLLNVGFSLVLTFYLLRLSRLIDPLSSRQQAVALLLLASMAVYYKTFVQIRGEPLLAMLSVMVLYYAVRLFVDGPDSEHARRDVIRLGVLGGLLALARQWGFLLFPSVGLLVVFLAWRQAERRGSLLKQMVATGAVSFATGGWFYILHLIRFGTVTPMNVASQPFSFSNFPASFYLSLGGRRLFERPVRPVFDREFWPMFYSETWGDYWGYFVLPAEVGSARLRDQTIAYLARVNRLALLPTALMLVGLARGLGAFVRVARGRAGAALRSDATRGLLAVTAVISLLGFLWFCTRYDTGGTTVKASYMIQIFPPLALLAAETLERLAYRSRSAYSVAVALLVGVLAHNLPVLLTRAVQHWPGN